MDRTTRRFGPLLGALLLAGAGCQQIHDATPAAAKAPLGAEKRVFEFTYTTTVPAPPPGTQELDVWVPVPLHDPGVQEVGDLRILVDGRSPAGRRTKDPVYGNEMLYLALEDRDHETEITWSARITRYEDLGQGQLPTVTRYLEANRLIPLDGEARRLASTLGADRMEDPIEERARRIYQDVLDAMEYNKKVPGYGLGDFNRAVTVCKGNCTDFHARFIGTGRAAGIPSRFTMGIPLKPRPSGTYNSYHCWAHWYDGERWRPVDISEADKIVTTDPEGAARFFGRLDPHRIALSVGRDLVLEPPQKGAPLNYFVFPYAEADGREVEMDKTMWEFRYQNVQP